MRTRGWSAKVRVARAVALAVALGLAWPAGAQTADTAADPPAAAAEPPAAAAPGATGEPAPAGEPTAAAEPAPVASEAPLAALAEIQGTTVPMGEITGRAKLVADRIRSLEHTLSEDAVETRLEPELIRLAEVIEPRVPEVGTRLATAPSLATLDRLRSEWNALEKEIGAHEERLQRRVSQLETDIEQLQELRALWERTVARAQSRGAPEGIVHAAEVAVTEISRVIDSARTTLNGVLIVQSQFGELDFTVRETLDQIDTTRDRILDNILVRDQPPIWSEAAQELAEPGAGDLGAFARRVAGAVSVYAAQHPDRVALHVLAFAILLGLVRRSRTSIALPQVGSSSEAEPDPVVAAALLATRHPIASAGVLALLLTPVFHGSLDEDLESVLQLVFVVPLLFVLRPLLGQALRGPLYLLTAFFVTDRVRDVLASSPGLAREVFLAEMAVGAILLLWLLRGTRVEALPAAARENRWLGAFGTWARVSVGAMVFALAAGAAGYMRVATLLGEAVLGSAYAALALYGVARIAESVAAAGFRGRLLGRVRMVRRHRELFVRRSRSLVRVAAVGTWIYVVLGMLALRDPLVAVASAALSTELGYGTFKFTLGGFAAFLVTLFAAWLVSRTLHFLLDEEVYPRFSLPRGVPFALSTLTRYTILLIGFLVAVSALGFDLDRITILLGAFGVGIGFGLQNVVNNFASGLILLFERPVKVGDRIELVDLEGKVQRIGIRSSTVRTLDGSDVIVPNATLVSDRVVNWTFADRLRRVVVPVGVAYGTDPHRVIALLEEVLSSHPEVCPEPAPSVHFVGFGESSLDFQVRAFTDKADDYNAVRSQVALATHDALVGAGIEIPFPQRDLHVRSAPK